MTFLQRKYISDKIGKKDITRNEMKFYNKRKRHFKRSYLMKKRGKMLLEQDVTFQHQGWMV
jgi:predicted nucleic-acid-binding protein